MLDYIALYPNKHKDELNMDFLKSTFDKPLDYYVIACMKDFESINNIEILEYKVIEDQDEVDINNHMININYKKKNLDAIPVPKYNYMMDSRYHEIDFKIRVKTNLHEKTIVKRILVPTLHDGVYRINNKNMKVIWQLVDASTYSRRGNVTMKSRNPIMIYVNKSRVVPDVNGVEHVLTGFSYAQDSSKKKRKNVAAARKSKMRFIDPLLLYLAKMGMKKTIDFFGMTDLVKVKRSYTKKDEKEYHIFECNEVYFLVKPDAFEHPMVRSFICMASFLQNRDFPVTWDSLEDKEYWICRIGYIGSIKSKNIISFYEKGRSTIHHVERTLSQLTIDSLRLPDVYKENGYQIIYWMITNFDVLKQRVNIDMKNKRIRKNEAIVDATLGRKIAENISKLIERKSKSKMNTMDTLLELFNFNSDIIVTGMRNMNDMVKSDDASNDMAFMNDMAYTCKGYQSLGEGNNKMIADKYRYLHPSMVGTIDLFTTSNSDCGMSGAIVPFVELYDGFFFTPEHEPCMARYKFECYVKEELGIDRKLPLDSFDDYIAYVSDKKAFRKELAYEPIEIIEKEV